MTESGSPGVLLVDDDSRVLSAIVRSLRREPIRLETAASAEEALHRLETETFDLVVSDQRMPGLSGIEFLRQVQARWPRTRRILLSGWISEIPRSDLEAADLHCLLAKPWDDGELRSVIRDAVGATDSRCVERRRSS